jgi:hypothetical protein
MHGALGPASEPGGLKERPALNQEAIPKILALVMFGDSGFSSTSELAVFGPQFPPLLFERLKQNCADGDMVGFDANMNKMLTVQICDPRGGDLGAHLSYDSGKWLKDSIDFIIAAFKGRKLPIAIRVPKDAGFDKPVPGRKPVTQADFTKMVDQIVKAFGIEMSL